jgi:hypothetical protein
VLLGARVAATLSLIGLAAGAAVSLVAAAQTHVSGAARAVGELEAMGRPAETILATGFAGWEVSYYLGSRTEIGEGQELDAILIEHHWVRERPSPEIEAYVAQNLECLTRIDLDSVEMYVDASGGRIDLSHGCAAPPGS